MFCIIKYLKKYLIPHEWGQTFFLKKPFLGMITKKEEEYFLKNIGRKIRELRLEKGLSQFELNIDANLSKNQIGRIERFEQDIKLTTLLKIAKALDIEVKDLFS